jgi:uncharacterized protein
VNPPDRWRCRLFVVQASPFCNLDCDYCYLPDRGNKARMSEATLKKAFERLFESGLLEHQLTVVWHAGEPLAVPIAWYDRAWEIVTPMTPAGIKIEESFQTNGTNIDARWCEYFKRRGSRVGVSVDGPALLNDKHRTTRSGRGTFDRTKRGMDLLHANGIDFHVISVLTWDALEYPDELYEFYVNSGVRRVGFNIEEKEGQAIESTLLREGVTDRYRRFLERFLERVQREPGRLIVRELDGAAAAILGGPPPGSLAADEPYNDQAEPFSILSVDHEGGFATFSPELLGMSGAPYGAFTLGNVHREAYRDVVATPRFQAMFGDIEAGCADCRTTCAYFSRCGGGAPANKYFENGSFRSTETLYCRLTRKVVIDVVLENLERRAASQTPRPAPAGAA